MWIIIALLVLIELYVLGEKGGLGPLKFLRQKKISKLEGNGPSYDFSSIEYSGDDRFKDKTLFILGSSVSRGEASLDQAVGEYLAGRFSMKLIKETVSGTCLAGEDPSSYVSRLKHHGNEKENVDLFLCQLSTNDIHKTKEMGKVSASYELSSFDTKTICGAMEYIIAYVKKEWNCPIFFYTNSYFGSEKYEEMISLLYELKDKWEIHVVDLYYDKEFNERKKDLYMADRIHPTKAGYRDWWGPEIERQILSSLNGE